MTTRISPQSVQKVAALARLHSQADSDFVSHFETELDAILSYVDELNSIPKSAINLQKRSTQVAQLRPDSPRENTIETKSIRDAIIANFPNSQGDLLILPGIFHDN